MKQLLPFLFIISVTLVLSSCGKEAITSSNREATAIAVESLPILEKLNGEISGVSSASSQPSSGRDTSSLDSSGTETKTPWLSDYDTFWTIVEENYPLYATVERITEKDFAKETYLMDDSSQLFDQLKNICVTVTEQTYIDCLQQGYTILIRLYNLGLTQEQAYEPLLQYHNSLDDGLPQDYIADIMDLVVGWCAPKWHIWRDDGRLDCIK